MMKLENSDRQDSSSSGVYRKLMMAAIAATAIGINGCGPGDSPNNETDAGTAGMAGSAGEGGTGGTGAGGTGGVEGGMGGTGGGIDCKNKPYDGLASQKFEVGQTGSVIIARGEQDPNRVYNGMKLTVSNGQVFTKSTIVGLKNIKYDNYPTGTTSVGDVNAIRVEVLDGDEPYVADQYGECQPKPVAVNAIADAALMEGPPNVFATVTKVRNDVEEAVPYAFTLQNTTQIPIASLDKADYPFGNRKPVVPDTITAVRDTDGHVVLTLVGTSDEGLSNEIVLSKLAASAPGLTFVPVANQPGVFRSAEVCPAGSINLTIAGSNQPLGTVDDTTLKSVNVTETDLCAGIDTNGHGTCSAGVVTCDPGFANNDANPAEDCDGCDTESGLYENDYPLCPADVTPPSTPVITTMEGEYFVVHQADYSVAGTTDPDTDKILYNVDGGPFAPLGNYTPNSTDWLYNGNIPNTFEDDTVCFKAVDKADNESGADCTMVTRLP